MEIDSLIEALNKKPNIAYVTSSNVDDTDFSIMEKAFIKTHRPESALIIYGTLAPGRSNHAQVAHLKGVWEQGIVRGKLIPIGWGASQGYNGFLHARKEEQEVISAFVLLSDELVKNWPALDAFEGNEYRRMLAKYELNNGVVGVGFIYAINAANL